MNKIREKEEEMRDNKVKFSMADSMMMLLVQQAMDKSHEKIKTRHGLLLRLNSISIFYELAVLQLEICLNFVQQETESSLLETNHKEVVHDLREIKDRLHHRLLETELAILEKDKELLDLSENQESLRNELVQLQDLERKRIRSSSKDYKIEDEFTELKSSVDQQVMNLRHKLEIENQLGFDIVEEDKMIVDIDVLKGTMDLAFNKMQNHALFLSELGSIEENWRLLIERDSIKLLIKGFLEDFKNGLEEKKEKIMMIVKDYEIGFKDQIGLIRREIECFESSPRSCGVTITSSSSLSLEYDNDEKQENEKQEDQEVQEEEEDESNNLCVSKLIKSHESIIRKKSEELVKPKIEGFKRQRSGNNSSSKLVLSIDNLMSLNSKFFKDLFDDYDDDDDDDDEKVVMVVNDGLDDVWLQMQKRRMVIEEKEDEEMKSMILEDIYLTLLKSFKEEEEIVSQKIESKLQCKECSENLEICQEDEEEIVNGKIESKLESKECLENLEFFQEKEEEIVRREIESKLECSENIEICQAEEEEIESKFECLENLEICQEEEEFRQEVEWIVVREMLKEVSEIIKNHEKIKANDIKVMCEEKKRAFNEISKVFDGFDFRIQEKLNMVTSKLQSLETKIYSTWDYVANSKQKESKAGNFQVISENLEICQEDKEETVSRKIKSKIESKFECKECSENLEICQVEEFRQEVDWIVVTEVLKQVSNIMKNHEKMKGDNIKMMGQEKKRAFYEISKLFDNCDFKIQEKLKMVTCKLQNLETKIASTSKFECKECSENLEIYQKDEEFRQEVDWIVVRELLKEVSDIVKNQENVKTNNIKVMGQEKKRANLEISKLFDGFDFKIQEKLKMVTFKLQNLETKIDSTWDYVTNLKQKESVYKTAFVLRTQNLIKAEIEVDLLGDQVESLMKILRKTFWVFHQNPLLLCNYSDISDISKMIKKELCIEDF